MDFGRIKSEDIFIGFLLGLTPAFLFRFILHYIYNVFIIMQLFLMPMSVKRRRRALNQPLLVQSQQTQAQQTQA